jgi:hypothetical protein
MAIRANLIGRDLGTFYGFLNQVNALRQIEGEDELTEIC